MKQKKRVLSERQLDWLLRNPKSPFYYDWQREARRVAREDGMKVLKHPPSWAEMIGRGR